MTTRMTNNIKTRDLINSLTELEDVLPEVRNTEIYVSAWKQFHENHGGEDYGLLTNKAQATYFQKVLEEMSLDNGEVIGVGGELFGVSYMLRNNYYALVSNIHGTHLSATIYSSPLADVDVDSVELPLEDMPLRDALKVAYYLIRYYHPRTN